MEEDLLGGSQLGEVGAAWAMVEVVVVVSKLAALQEEEMTVAVAVMVEVVAPAHIIPKQIDRRATLNHP
jgi:hypothetical protein